MRPMITGTLLLPTGAARTGAALATAVLLMASLGAGAARAADPSIASLSLINADSNQPVAAYTPLTSGAALNQATLPTRNLNIRAFTSPATTGSVKFVLDGQVPHVESGAPYALAGDSPTNDYLPWTPAVGNHTLTVTAYTGGGATGTAGTPTTLTFSVTNAVVSALTWPSSWVAGSWAPQPRFESAISVLGGKIYAFGGFSDSNFHVNRSYVAYDAAANHWTTLGTLPAGMAETHTGLANDGRYVYFAGGFGGDLHGDQSPSQWISDRVWRYDSQTNTWSQIATLPQPRGAGALVLVGRKLHYFGGNPADRVTDVGNHYVYDLDTQAWTSAAAMPDPKDHFSSALLGGKIYAIGGEHGHDQLHQQQSTVHAYDPAAGTWSQRASLPTAKSHTEGGTFVSDGQIVMAGGQVDNFYATTQAVAYNPATNSWRTLGALPAPRQGAAVQRVGSTIVLGLGAEFTSQPQGGVWRGQLP